MDVLIKRKKPTAQCPELTRLLSESDGLVCESTGCEHNVFFTKLGFKRIDTEKSRSIKNCLCALTDGDRFTLEEIAEMYGVTRERIRQIEEKAIQKLRAFVLRHPEGQRILDGFISRKEREEGMRLYRAQKEKDRRKREGFCRSSRERGKEVERFRG